MSEQNVTQYQSLTFKEKTRIPIQMRSRQNTPIRTELETRRVYQKEPIDTLSWAYMKLLRERDRTKKIFAANPFVEVYRFRENLYGILSESADGAGDVWAYLDIGDEKALLVDTGFGIGDLNAVIRELIGKKQLMVVNTHAHFDHAYGNCQFDCVYCHEYEAQAIASQNAHMWDYLFDEAHPDRGIWLQLERSDIVPFRKYSVIACPDGFEFDLGGGHKVELIHMGGHTSGHAAFLDKKHGWLFCGDNIVSMRVGVGGPRPNTSHPECATIPYLTSRLEILHRRKAEYTHLFTGHFITDLEAECVADMLEACREICADPSGACSYKKDFPAESLTRYYREVKGLGMISYSSNSFFPGSIT